MRFELFIALRYLTAKRKQAFISIISLISILGVGLGVASLIVVLGVMNGFSTDLREKILGVNAHMVLAEMGGAMHDYREIMAKVDGVPGVLGATPFVYSELMLGTPRGVKGVIVRGVDPKTAGGVLSLGGDLVKGRLDGLDAEDGLPGIIVGEELARRMGLFLGSAVNLLSPSGRQSAAGFTPKVKTFVVRGVFKSGMFEYDTSMAYVGVAAAQKLLGFKKDLVTGLEIRVDDVYNVANIGKAVREAVGGPPYYVRTWIDMNGNLFEALQLEKAAMFIILVMIVLVGSFSIITTLVMLVMEKTRDIAILTSMGATAAGVRRIFMYQGTIIGLMGTALGYVIGLPLCLALEKYQFIKLPENVYPMNYLPIRLDWFDLGVVGVVAFALCFLATLYPARQAARLKPAEALRHD